MRCERNRRAGRGQWRKATTPRFAFAASSNISRYVSNSICTSSSSLETLAIATASELTAASVRWPISGKSPGPTGDHLRRSCPLGPPIPCKFYVLAGAAWNYPGGIDLAFYSFNEDFVPLLSLDASFDKNAFGVFNALKSQNSTSFNDAASGMTNNAIAAHGIDGYFLGKFADDIRADLGLPRMSDDDKMRLRLEFMNDMNAMGINL